MHDHRTELNREIPQPLIADRLRRSVPRLFRSRFAERTGQIEVRVDVGDWDRNTRHPGAKLFVQLSGMPWLGTSKIMLLPDVVTEIEKLKAMA